MPLKGYAMKRGELSIANKCLARRVGILKPSRVKELGAKAVAEELDGGEFV